MKLLTVLGVIGLKDLDFLTMIIVSGSCVIAFIVCIIVWNLLKMLIHGPYERMLCKDAVGTLRDKLPDLKGWEPSKAELEKFKRKWFTTTTHYRVEVSRSYEDQELADLICFLLAFKKRSTSLVIGLVENDDYESYEYLWLRFYWENRWWVCWFDVDSGKPECFRAIPEVQVESIAKEDYGLRIIAYNAIPHDVVSDFFSK